MTSELWGGPTGVGGGLNVRTHGVSRLRSIDCLHDLNCAELGADEVGRQCGRGASRGRVCGRSVARRSRPRHSSVLRWYSQAKPAETTVVRALPLVLAMPVRDPHAGAMGHEADLKALERISALVAEEHDLRNGSQVDATRLRALEEELDQCWDLLRQRRARREFDQDPDEAHARSTSVVEGYQQ